jgi:hypothetical protein
MRVRKEEKINFRNPFSVKADGFYWKFWVFGGQDSQI